MSDEFGAEYAQEQIRRRNAPLRRIVKRLYLRNLLPHFSGPTIDLGCGAGQLLERLPAGSLGLETNPHLVLYLSGLGLDARRYDALADDCNLGLVDPGRYRHLVCAHVLEHFTDPAQSLRKLAVACARLGVTDMTIVVPGERGFQSDPTHKTFVTADFIETHGLRGLGAFRFDSVRYFPGNHSWLGRWFVYHECILRWSRT